MVDGRPTETSRDWEIPPNVSSNGSNGAPQNQHACEDEQKSLYFCDVPDCHRRKFSRQYDLKRHKIEQHSSDTRRYICGPCRQKKVEKPFVRKDKLMTHLRSVHNMHGSVSRRCSEGPCGTEGTNYEIHFATQPELDQHLIESHKICDAATPESNHEPSKFCKGN
jgi:hypothetical protein